MNRLLHIAGSMTAYRDTDNRIYFNGNYTNEVWQRYFNIAKVIVVLCKVDRVLYTPEEANKRFKAAPTENFEVRFINDLYISSKDFFNAVIRKDNEEILLEEIRKADAVDLKNLGFVSVSYFLAIMKKYQKKYLYECIGDAWDAMWNHGLKGKVLAPKAFYDQKRIAAEADMVLYVTEEFLQKRYPTQAPQIGLSDVNIPESNEQTINKRINKINRMNPTKIVLGTTAGIDVPYKGQKYVIEALGYLKRNGITCFEYQLVGGGKAENLLNIANKENVSEYIKILGSKSHDGVIEWLESIDIYIQPSLQEGLPRALAEAMSMALPAIGSRTGGIPELLEDKCIFEKKNVKQIAHMLKKLRDITVLLKYANRNYEFIKKFNNNRSDLLRREFYERFNNLVLS